jgi:hypothetical protein
MTIDTESLVRERAYQIWELENRPVGRDKQHWDAALREVMAVAAPKSATRVRKSASAASAAAPKKTKAPKAK